MEIIDNFLNEGQYVKEITNKNTIYLHHTAGAHNPINVIRGWNTDKQGRVGTAYLIGGISSNTKDHEWDGKIVRAFDDKYWAYHLNIGNTATEKKSIGIEICNFGQIRKINGKFYTYLDTEIHPDLVYKLDIPYRNFEYYHKYTDKQIDSLKQLIIYLADKHNIDIKSGMIEILNHDQYSLNPNMSTLELQQWLNERGYTDHNGKALVEDGIDGSATLSAKNKAEKNAFDIQNAAKMGQPGIWTHTNVRTDKWDCHPQPELINMLLSL